MLGFLNWLLTCLCVGASAIYDAVFDDIGLKERRAKWAYERRTYSYRFWFAGALLAMASVVYAEPNSDARARAALALAVQSKTEPKAVVAKPFPGYLEAARKAANDKKPLVVFFIQPARQIEGVIVAHEKADRDQPIFDGVSEPSIIVALPHEGWLKWQKTMPANATDAQIRQAISIRTEAPRANPERTEGGARSSPPPFDVPPTADDKAQGPVWTSARARAALALSVEKKPFHVGKGGPWLPEAEQERLRKMLWKIWPHEEQPFPDGARFYRRTEWAMNKAGTQVVHESDGPKFPDAGRGNLALARTFTTRKRPSLVDNANSYSSSYIVPGGLSSYEGDWHSYLAIDLTGPVYVDDEDYEFSDSTAVFDLLTNERDKPFELRRLRYAEQSLHPTVLFRDREQRPKPVPGDNGHFGVAFTPIPVGKCLQCHMSGHGNGPGEKLAGHEPRVRGSRKAGTFSPPVRREGSMEWDTKHWPIVFKGK